MSSILLEFFYRKAIKALSESRHSYPEAEARYLIQEVGGYSTTDLISHTSLILDKSKESLLEQALSRRVNGEPLSKITGKKEFWGRDFIVNNDVLDPRPDTETLIEAVLQWVGNRKNEALRILDLGTGTGCIPITLLHELPQATAVAIDISDKALAIARQNSAKYKMSNRLELRQGDWLEGLDGQYFDIICSNPPYISEPDILNLMPEVKNHDPVLALAGGKNGLECYQKILFSLKKFLNGKNRAFFEIGFGQLESLQRLVDDSNLSLCDSHKDLAGIPRVVEISCGDK